MKYCAKYLSLLLLLICFGPMLHAQLIIAKDPRECLVGLKDSSGNWVVAPAYTQIEYYSRAYKVHSGGKEGIMSWSGKLIVPAVYDKVEPCWYQAPGLPDNYLDRDEQKNKWRYYTCFVITNNEKKGLAGTDGRVIIPPSLLSLTYFFNGIAIGVNEQNQSVLADTTGILCTLPAEYSISPEESSMLATKRFLVEKKGVNDKGEATVSYGVCNERGKLVIPAIYRGFAEGLWRLNVLVADSAGYHGVFSVNGKQLTPCVYGLRRTPVVDENTFNDFAFISRDGRTGVLGRNGKIVVPCAYDSIGVARKSIHETLFLCHNGAHEDVYSDTKAILVNHQYDEVRIAQLGNYYFDPLVLFFVAKDEKWGALSESLHEYMPVQFDTIFVDESYYLFYSDSSVRALYPNGFSEKRMMAIVPAPAVKPSGLKNNSPYEPYFSYEDTLGQMYTYYSYDDESGKLVDTFYMRSILSESDFCEVWVHDVWTDDSLHIVWELPVHIGYLPACERNQYSHDAPSCFFVAHNGKSFTKLYAYKNPLGNTLYFSSWNTGSGIYPSTGGPSIVPRSDKMHFNIRKNNYQDTTGYIEIITSTGRQGTMSLDGKLMFDTLWYESKEFNNDTFWVATAERDWYDRCSPVWNLYSVSQRRLLLDTNLQFLTPPMNPGETGVGLTRTGVGLFDAKTLRFIIPPVYRYIFPLDDSLQHFLITDFNGVTKITDHKGKSVSKLTVDRAALINQTSTWYDEHGIDSFLIYSVKTPEATFIAGNFGVRNYKSLNRDSLFSFFRQQPAAHVYRSSDAPVLVIDSTITLRRWHRELFCDSFVLGSMNPDYRASPGYYTYSGYPVRFHQQTETMCENLWPLRAYAGFYSETRHPTYIYTWSNQRSLCFRAECEIRRYPAYSYETYFLIDSVPVKQYLSDLFIGEQWKPVIINALLARLDSQPQIRANCTDVTRYPDLLADRFMVTGDSLLLFPDWGMERYLYNPGICVAISWKELTPFLKPETRSVLEIH